MKDKLMKWHKFSDKIPCERQDIIVCSQTPYSHSGLTFYLSIVSYSPDFCLAIGCDLTKGLALEVSGELQEMKGDDYWIDIDFIEGHFKNNKDSQNEVA